MKSIFEQIERLIPTLDGWCTPERACELAAIVVGLKPKTTVCVGVWGGRDTFAMALAHQYNGFGRVVAIDPWAAVASVQGQQGADAEWWASQERHDYVYGQFIANMHRLGLANFIEVNKAKAAAVEPPSEIGVLIVDGNHGPDSIADVERFAPRVVNGGVVYCDDINWAGGAVVEAVRRLKSMCFRELYTRDTGAFFQRG
jgi:predicted O-methyltransferase YrrM